MIANVILPGGLWIDGERHQSADVRPLTGADEEYLRDLDSRLSMVQRISELLDRCVTRIGPVSPVQRETIRDLTVGDREALLLHLRRLTLGQRMQCVIQCPECSERLDLDVTIDQLLVPPYADAKQWYETVFSENGTTYKIRYRAALGGDQEAVANLAKVDQQQAANVLLRRCIEVFGDDHRPLKEIPEAVERHVAELLPTRDPQAELRLHFDCASCRRPISALLDAAAFLFRDLGLRVPDLYREIHTLALHYHWSEQEILAMTAPKRHRYLNLIAESGSRLGA